MDKTQLVMNLVTSVGMHLPVLIALGVALIMAWDTPRGRVRSVALGGLALLLVAQLGRGLASAVPLLLIARGDFGALSGSQAVLGGLQFVLAILAAAGFILLGWALVRALRGQAR